MQNMNLYKPHIFTRFEGTESEEPMSIDRDSLAQGARIAYAAPANLMHAI